jgi:hypothetical protein
VLRIRVPFRPLDPGWEKVSIRIRDEQPGSYFLELRNHFFAFFEDKILKFFDEDPGSGMETVRIRDKHPGSATLQERLDRKLVRLYSQQERQGH